VESMWSPDSPCRLQEDPWVSVRHSIMWVHGLVVSAAVVMAVCIAVATWIIVIVALAVGV